MDLMDTLRAEGKRIGTPIPRISHRTSESIIAQTAEEIDRTLARSNPNTSLSTCNTDGRGQVCGVEFRTGGRYFLVEVYEISGPQGRRV